jgi:hypothetical protein
MIERTLQLWQRETMLATRQPTMRRTGSAQTKQDAEKLLRDLAFVLKMTEKVKESMVEEACSV